MGTARPKGKASSFGEGLNHESRIIIATSPALTGLVLLLARYGQPVALNPGIDGARTLQGMVTPMDNSSTNLYFDANESVGLLKPAFMLYTSGADGSPPVPGDIFYYTDSEVPARISGGFGGPLTVRKTQTFRVGSTAVLVLSLCD